ncbi:MAG: tetratricopeptide repeat protein [Anaerolineales bacterium]|nr:tetratricopeptide repeat protein [Anaerolineales bacterium]
MSQVFLPSESKSIFVGREPQIAGFKSILNRERPEWILHIPGEGGIGKTRLLEKYEKIAREQYTSGLAVTGLIDFYDTSNQSEIGLLNEIALRLGFDPSGAFRKESNEFQKLSASKDGENAVFQDRLEQVFEKFLAEYKVLLGQKERVLLLFDTCEEMKGVEEWVLDRFFEEIDNIEGDMVEVPEGGEENTHNRKTIVVIVGRKELDFHKNEKYKGQFWTYRLPLLELKDIKDYFSTDIHISESIDEKGFEQIYERTGGRPLYVALVYDWLSNDVGTLSELLGMTDSFAAGLVGWVRRLEPNKKMTILYMAFAWRRMELSLLSDLLALPMDKVQKIVDEMVKFSFIKYREIEDGHFVINLHDEMRMLINEYVWPKEITEEMGKPYPLVLDWYKTIVNDPELFEGKNTPVNDRERALLSEDLYYRLKRSLPEGLKFYESRFATAVHYLDLAYCDMLNQEVVEFKNQLPQEERDKFDFRMALTAFRKEEYQRAGSIWHAFIRRPDVSPAQRATTLMQLVELDSYTGNPKEAILHAKEAEIVYLALIKTAKSASERSHLKNQLGQLYNNWGFACRVSDNYKQALEYYKKALQIPGQSLQAKKHKARVLNNMGFIYYRLGDVERARTYVGRALNIRRDLNIPYELGLGFNTFGLIMEDGGRIPNAVDLFTKAYQSFEDAHSNRGKAMAQINLGRMQRFMNNYDEALNELTRAEKVLKKLYDQDNLITVLNEIGTTYREKQDWTNALKYLNESLVLSEKLGKRFQQTDTLDDIAVTYYKMATRSNEKDRGGYIEKAKNYANKSQKLAKNDETDFFVAKADIVLGDLFYLEEEYTAAFKHYFEAASLMAKAWASRHKASGFYQRRYEESLDKMQERLHAFEREEGIEKTLTYVKRLLAKIEQLPPVEKVALSKMRKTLKATLETTKLAR